MSESKRYGAIPDRHPAGDDGFEGWTLEEIAENTHSGQPRHARELARDLIAAQARIAELERDNAALTEVGDAVQGCLDGAEARLAAAESTIARVRERVSRFRKYVHRGVMNDAGWCADELEAALSPAKGGE